MRKWGIIYLVILISVCGYAQDRAEFTRDKEFYLKGNATVIGNSILGKNKSKAFDKPDMLNDEFKMRYIDIDSDSKTWSSSSAYLEIPEGSAIAYASLYWTATYFGERSAQRLSEDAVVYKKLEERAHNPQEIKIKVPNGTYQDVQGSLVYDGENAKNRTVKSRAPYAYAADVTEILQGYYQGDITVANIAATQGKMSGGSSAGWLLYVIYEDDTQPFQYITTYYGLESIKKEVVEIDFGNFKSSKNGELFTQVTVGALEGDSNLDKDQIRIYNPKSDLYLPFGNRVRPANNFFNSSITSGEEIVLSRNPNSKNTLGFDIAQVKLDSELNTILTNSAQGVKMQFNTRGDHYFLFFIAFQTTISESFYKEIIDPGKEIAPEDVQEIVVVEEEKQEVKETVLEEPVVVTEPIVKENQLLAIPTTPVTESEPLFNEKLVEIVDKPAVNIPGIRSGFYIISNVFSSQENAQKWEKTLANKDLSSFTFLRPDNNLYYVSLGNNTDPLIMYQLLKTIRGDESLNKAWILKINM